MTSYVESPGLPRGFVFSDSVHPPLALRPTGLLTGAAARAAVEGGRARPLAGGPLAFASCEAFLDGGDAVHTVHTSLDALSDWAAGEGGAAEGLIAGALARLTAARPPFAGIALDAPRIAGIVNVTPDSFHDGGAHEAPADAITHGRVLLDAGADMLDVGGESTRPGAAPVAPDEEIARVVPVIAALAEAGAVVSVDTSHAAVMRAALAAGAAVVNDVTALAGDPDSLAVVAGTGASVILMHMQGEPRTMQQDPRYGHVLYEVYRWLEARVQACEAAGIPRARIAVDPGIGFGKTPAHSLKLIAGLAMLHGMGCAVMAGASRKSFITAVAPDTPTAARLPGSLCAAVLAAGQGVQLHRVHDAAETRQALDLWAATAAAAG